MDPSGQKKSNQQGGQRSEPPPPHPYRPFPPLKELIPKAYIDVSFPPLMRGRVAGHGRTAPQQLSMADSGGCLHRCLPSPVLRRPALARTGTGQRAFAKLVFPAVAAA